MFRGAQKFLGGRLRSRDHTHLKCGSNLENRLLCSKFYVILLWYTFFPQIWRRKTKKQKKCFHQRWSRGHKARGQGHKKFRGQGHKKFRGQGQGQPFRGQTLSRPAVIVIVITFYSPSCLGQETAKGPFGLRVKLPPAHLSTTHDGGFTLSL